MSIPSEESPLQRILNSLQASELRRLNTLRNASSNTNIHLSDKNRLLATINSNIQKSNLRLNEINDQINTITQDIYMNNISYDRKETIIKTMRSIILILIILLVVMMVYYGSGFVESRFPNAYNSLKNNFSFGKSNFSKFNSIKF